MARQLRFTGTDSKVDGCPALHTDEGTCEIIVQGVPVTDPEDRAQLQHFGADEAAAAVPRELLVNWGPKEMERVPELVDRATFRRLFETFKHTAWRLETRRGYASDRQDPDFQEFLATGSSPCDSDEPWFVNIKVQTDAGKRSAEFASPTIRPQPSNCSCSTTPGTTPRAARTFGTCGARTPPACPPKTSGSSTRGWWRCCTSTTKTT